MSNEQGRRIEANCRILWGPGDYELDCETDDYEWYQAFVRKDFGYEFGLPLTMTMLVRSSERAWDELDRMLDISARQKQRKQEMAHNKEAQLGGKK